MFSLLYLRSSIIFERQSTANFIVYLLRLFNDSIKYYMVKLQSTKSIFKKLLFIPTCVMKDDKIKVDIFTRLYDVYSKLPINTF